MSSKNPKKVVVDANIARSAGGKETLHPEGAQSRDFLQKIRDEQHIVLICKELKEEYQKHGSVFFMHWQVAMARRGLRKECEIEEEKERTILFENLTHDEFVIASKVLFLFKLSLQGDRIIISKEYRCVDKIVKVINYLPDFFDIMWVNLTGNFNEKLIWLKNGCRLDDKYKILHDNFF